MRVSHETWFIADDGSRFEDADKCGAHEALCAKLTAALAPLGARPDIDHGTYVKHDPEVVRGVTISILLIAKDALGESRISWIDDTLESLRAGSVKGDDNWKHPSWVGRLLSDHGGPLSDSWWRISCTDEHGREWDQPYFANNPDRGNGEHKPSDSQ
jgi:hypothetical protein